MILKPLCTHKGSIVIIWLAATSAVLAEPRANETLDCQFYQDLFGKLYQGCINRSPKQDFGLKEKLFSLDASLDAQYAAID